MPGKSDHQVLSGLLMGIIAIIMVLGSLTTALSEGPLAMAGEAATGQPTDPVAFILETPTPASDLPILPSPTLHVQISSSSASSPATPTPTTNASSVATTPHVCAPPGGWYVITVQSEDTLASLANKYHTSLESLAKANCFTSTTTMTPGTIVYVPGPPLPASTSCAVPAGWSKYIIQSGDTLNLLGQRTNTTSQMIQEGNCLDNPTLIRVGQTLFLPSLSHTATPAQWNSLTPAYVYPSVTYQPLYTLIPTTTYVTPAFQSPMSSTTPPVIATPWPSGIPGEANIPWPSATAG
jgi:LysM repeat protein